MLRYLIAATLVGVLAAPLAAVRADDAQDAAKEALNGRTLLANGDFAGAIAAFEAAAAKDPANQEYATAARATKQAVERQAKLDAEQDPAKWSALASEQRAFLYDNEAYASALMLDEQLAAKQPGTASTVLLAESMYEAGKDAEAVAALQNIPETDATAVSRAYLAVGLARQQKRDEARELLNKFEVPKEVDPHLLLVLSRAYAVQGNNDLAVAAVTRSIELTPSAKVPAWKTKISRTRDFSALFHDGLFQNAVQSTESKVEKTG